MLKLDKVCFSYNSVILDEVSLDVSEGEIVAIIGPSGSGKTTLFQLIAGLKELEKGSISIFNEADANKRSQQISYMMQEDLLLPWRTLLGNMMLVYEFESKQAFSKLFTSANRIKKNFCEKALYLLNEVGLKGYEDYYPDELSGGMRQRASLARSLLFSKPLLLLDEPFGAVDYFKRQELYRLMKTLQMKYNLTILFITHDLFDAKALADKIFLLREGELIPYQLGESLHVRYESKSFVYEFAGELI